MLAELAERDATGPIAEIYAAIRRLWAAPYVSSLQRHLATRPGWLEWTWAAVGPAFMSGQAQDAAWRAAARVEVPRLSAVSAGALRVWGVDGAGEEAIATACESFVRVSPVNLVLSGLVRRLLHGERPGGRPARAAVWVPPPAPAALPAMVDVTALPPAERAVLGLLTTTVGVEPFVPGLYRMLARWPALLAHLATELAPRFDDPAILAACARVLESIDAEVPAVLADLPPLPAPPPDAHVDAVLAALATYRKTSPEMVVFGRMVRDALPDRAAA